MKMTVASDINHIRHSHDEPSDKDRSDTSRTCQTSGDLTACGGKMGGRKQLS